MIDKISLYKIIEQYSKFLNIRIPVVLGKFNDIENKTHEAESQEEEGKWVIYLKRHKTQAEYEQDIIFELLHCYFRQTEERMENLAMKMGINTTELDAYWQALLNYLTEGIYKKDKAV